MLRISDVVRLARRDETDIEVLKRHPYYRYLKGESTTRGIDFGIRIYIAAIRSPKDFHLTLLHEMIHLRDDYRGMRGDEQCDPWVESEAIETYRKQPEIVDLIKELYGVNNFEYYQQKYGLLKKTA